MIYIDMSERSNTSLIVPFFLAVQFLHLFNSTEQFAPSYFTIKQRSVVIERKPYKNSFPNYMIAWNKTPETAVS